MKTKGKWVEIENVILKAGDRAPQVPDDTQKVPYVLRVSGFLQGNQNAKPGDSVSVITLIGRTLSGKLINLNPGYHHTFGDTVPELLDIGLGDES
jgi:hypothetical protein